MDLHDLAGTLRSPEVFSLAERAVRDYIDWDELAHLPLPPGLTLAETWELLGTIRQFGAIWFPIPTLDRRQFWYGLTQDARHCLKFIDRHCRSDSSLEQLMRERKKYNRFLLKARADEAVATCRVEGIDVDPADLNRMTLGGRSAQNAGEQLALNMYAMLDVTMDDLAREPFSEDLVHFLYERLTADVDVDALSSRSPLGTGLTGTVNPEQWRNEAGRRGVLKSICDYANGTIGDPLEPTPVRAFLLKRAMQYWRVLPELNDAIALQVYRLFVIKRHYPGLVYLPTTAKTISWLEGTLPPGTTRFSRVEWRPVVQGSIDGTEDVITHLELVSAALRKLLGFIELAQQEDRSLEETLAAAPLNYRQRSVLAEALRNPSAESRIRQHQNTFHVVYRTARADLIGLVERGYFTQELVGKAMVFRPVDQLRETIQGRCDLPNPIEAGTRSRGSDGQR